MDRGLPHSNNDLLQQEADKKGSILPPLIYYIPLRFGMIEGLVCKAGFLSTRSQMVLLSILSYPRKQYLLGLALVFFCPFILAQKSNRYKWEEGNNRTVRVKMGWEIIGRIEESRGIEVSITNNKTFERAIWKRISVEAS